MTEHSASTSAGSTVVLAGATSAAGLAVTRALVAAGAHVTATGRSPERLRVLAESGAETVVADATSFAEMAAEVRIAIG